MEKVKRILDDIPPYDGFLYDKPEYNEFLSISEKEFDECVLSISPNGDVKISGDIEFKPEYETKNHYYFVDSSGNVKWCKKGDA